MQIFPIAFQKPTGRGILLAGYEISTKRDTCNLFTFQ